MKINKDNTNKKKWLIAILIIVILIISFVLIKIFVNKDEVEDTEITEKCFISLQINESKTANSINFSLIKTEALYGNYNFFDIKGIENYNLKIYSKSGIKERNISSSRFIYYDNWDDSDNPGGVIELNSSILGIIIDYDKEINKITITSNGTETDLGVNINKIKCERTCKIKGEIGSYEKNEDCCSIYRRGPINVSNFACIVCGDNRCEKNEDIYSCAEDCA